jgi:predicted DsbA family dithiol-disulfide isomerase
MGEAGPQGRKRVFARRHCRRERRATLATSKAIPPPTRTTLLKKRPERFARPGRVAEADQSVAARIAVPSAWSFAKSLSRRKAVQTSSFFTAQRLLTHDLLISMARMVGLDVRSFDRELRGHVHIAHIRDDFMSGVRSGVNGTPAFYINGVRHEGAWDFESLLTALNQASARDVKLVT